MKTPTQAEFVRLKTIVDIEKDLFRVMDRFEGEPEMDGLLVAAAVVSSHSPEEETK